MEWGGKGVVAAVFIFGLFALSVRLGIYVYIYISISFFFSFFFLLDSVFPFRFLS